MKRPGDQYIDNEEAFSGDVATSCWRNITLLQIMLNKFKKYYFILNNVLHVKTTF